MATLQSAEAPERRGVRVPRGRGGTGDDANSLRGGATAAARRTEHVGFLRLQERFFPVADEAAASNLEDHGSDDYSMLERVCIYAYSLKHTGVKLGSL